MYGNFSNKNFFSDEVYFTLSGYVNKQNCPIWGSEKVIVWCDLWSEGMIEPYFFENDDGTTVTVNSEGYGYLITDFFLSAIEKYEIFSKSHFNKPVLHATQLYCKRHFLAV